jgi:hypothetical protein
VSSAVPLWAALLLGLGPSLAAVAAIVAAEVRDRRRLDHEREMQQLELEERRLSTLREERLRAYSTMARLTKIVDAENPDPAPDLAEAHSEIEMLTDNPELTTAAAVLMQAWGDAWDRARAALEAGAENPYGSSEFKTLKELLDRHRTTFIRLARDEMKVEPPSHSELAEGFTPLPRPFPARRAT